jgi:hypothetical protein
MKAVLCISRVGFAAWSDQGPQTLLHELWHFQPIDTAYPKPQHS